MSFHPSYNNPPFPGAVVAYQKFASQHGFQPEVVQLGQGAEGYWFGSSTATKVIMFFPGGAYSNPASEGFFLRFKHLVEAGTSNGIGLGIFVLSYGLTPKEKYPTQLRQAVAALQYLLETKGVRPNDVGGSHNQPQMILAGDSAGGNLALALLSHLSHPHPDVAHVDLGGQTLRGALLISPWVSFDYDTPSAEANKDIDMISAQGCKVASRQFIGSTPEDEYTVPLRANPEWWKGLRADRCLITSGSYEIFASDIAAFAEKFGVYNPHTDVFVAKHEIHDQGLIDTMLGYQLPESERYAQQWTIEVLGP